MSNIDILGCQLFPVLGVKLDLLSVEIIRFALSKHKSVFIPVVKHELLVLQFENIFVVLNYEAGSQLMVNNVRDLLVVKLQKVRKGFGQ